MDDLKTALDTLSPDDQKEFVRFVRSHQNKKNRKDLQLYQLLRQRKLYSSAQLIQALYPSEPNAVAYYALRKRLMRHLTNFLLLKQTEEDNTTASSLMGTISLVRYLFAAQADRIAWNLLRKAEKMAQESEQYDLLNTLYTIQIEQADSEFADELTIILEKRNQNKQLAEEDERASIATSLIRHRLHQFRREGVSEQAGSFESIISQVLAQYQLTGVMSRSPKFLYKLLSITRSAVLVRKDFHAFEPYIREQYHLMEKEHRFAPAHRYYKQGLLYMLAQTLYRNGKFTESIRYLEQPQEELQLPKNPYYQEFYPRNVLLLAANRSFLQKNEEAIVLLQDLLQNAAAPLSHEHRLNAQLNLSFYYFQRKEYKQANQTLLGIHHSDSWCVKKMGKEWVLKKNLSELILQYELGNVDLALNKMRSITRQFSELLTQPPYANVRNYLELIDELLHQPDEVTRHAFLRRVESTLQFAPIEQEDLQAINFYAWLKSKMIRRDYYDVLLDLVRGKGQ